MATVERSILIGYSVRQMFDLVENIEAYPDFLPWCERTQVSYRDTSRTVATLFINFRGVKAHFTTENDKNDPAFIGLRLVDGPFRRLDGGWHFHPLGEHACKVELRLAYEFSNRLFDKMIGPVFGQICNTFVDAFARRAEAVLGEGNG
ncbi:type II toxin-antitoxin system RatA family toxin [uncultured Propionivibrio sp.]|uniref:type II toxin-antitoxin system RatA family toxin n=1 Tax=uncultured Propionivibrio sp. TaxID=426737 RepID=UPI0029BFB3F2|nr:type II toxin-antitoxin system RatA family toxin [uncultured Propionivibrio sp.]